MLADVEGKLKPADKKSVTRIEEVIGSYCAKPPSEKETKLVGAAGRCRLYLRGSCTTAAL